VVKVDRKFSLFVLPVNADQLPAGPFECELDNVEGKSAMTPIKGDKNPDVALVQIQFPTKNLPAGRHTLILRSASKPGDPITYTFEVQDFN
jgi:hypothetical protein